MVCQNTLFAILKSLSNLEVFNLFYTIASFRKERVQIAPPPPPKAFTSAELLFFPLKSGEDQKKGLHQRRRAAQKFGGARVTTS